MPRRQSRRRWGPRSRGCRLRARRARAGLNLARIERVPELEMPMFITKKFLNRRTVLRGAGAMIALPLLDAMVPATTILANTAAKPLVKLGFIYFPHGAIREKWTPEKEGMDFELTPILAQLKPFQKQLTLISGLGNRPGESQAVH